MRRWIRGAFTPYRARLAAELEDVEQQVLLELLGALASGRFEGRSRLATYVRRMVHHKCLNRLRALRGRQWVEVESLDLPDPGAAPDERAGREAARVQALRVLAAMPESCRELWRMILRGLGYDEMAERLGVAAGTLRVRVLRCRQRAIAERDRLAAVSGVTPAPAGGRREG
ncbi:MAG TPA: sigma-70 family RNA polymerase sigma factor [Thermoanaerobaculia bacterium]|nr:sigma-70 family RNA polymerase sigma factor [Thermoanaerobaculia bacterium]